jgi:hypothetical protein
MKKLILMLCLSAFVLMPDQNLEAQLFNLPNVDFEVNVKTKIIIARPKKECQSGLWICVIQVVIIGDATIKGSLRNREVLGEVIRTDRDDALLIKFDSNLPAEAYLDEVAYLEGSPDEAYDLPPDLVEQLGLRSARILPGKYEIKTSENGYKYVWLSAQME